MKNLIEIKDDLLKWIYVFWGKAKGDKTYLISFNKFIFELVYIISKIFLTVKINLIIIYTKLLLRCWSHLKQLVYLSSELIIHTEKIHRNCILCFGL